MDIQKNQLSWVASLEQILFRLTNHFASMVVGIFDTRSHKGKNLLSRIPEMVDGINEELEMVRKESFGISDLSIEEINTRLLEILQDIGHPSIDIRKSDEYFMPSFFESKVRSKEFTHERIYGIFGHINILFYLFLQYPRKLDSSLNFLSDPFVGDADYKQK